MNPGAEEYSSERRGLAIASLILGVVGLFLSLFVVGAVLGLVGLALGMGHILAKRGRNGMALWGIGLSIMSIIAGIGLGIVYFQFFKMARDSIATMASQASPMANWEGVLAPNITVTTLDGKTLRLSELKGKRVVLDFWATWCGPCVKEIPDFVRLHNETSRDDLVIIGISQEDTATLKSFVQKKAVNYPIASATDLPEPFAKPSAIPTTFFIDRKGVIQSVTVGSRSYSQLRDLATAADFSGEPKTKPPAPVASGLKDADKTLQAGTNWSISLPGATALCQGDWDGDGKAEILVLEGSRLHVLGVDGAEKTVVSLPEAFSTIELGHHKQKGARLLGYSNWGHQARVFDTSGKELWSYSAGMGLDGAHWGDLDGDGNDELIVGMNGFSGLDAVSADGKKLWHVALGNVWGQAVISAGSRPGGALVFATEAGGSVRVFDGKGVALGNLRPQQAYCTKIAAGIVDKAGNVQILALAKNLSGGGEDALAFDSKGQVAWSSPINSGGNWVNTRLACGDLSGDGNLVWAFIEPSGDLVVASAAGEKFAAIPSQPGASDFVIVSSQNGRGQLVVIQNGKVYSYSFQ